MVLQQCILALFLTVSRIGAPWFDWTYHQLEHIPTVAAGLGRRLLSIIVQDTAGIGNVLPRGRPDVSLCLNYVHITGPLLGRSLESRSPPERLK